MNAYSPWRRRRLLPLLRAIPWTRHKERQHVWRRITSWRRTRCRILMVARSPPGDDATPSGVSNGHRDTQRRPHAVGVQLRILTRMALTNYSCCYRLMHTAHVDWRGGGRNAIGRPPDFPPLPTNTCLNAGNSATALAYAVAQRGTSRYRTHNAHHCKTAAGRIHHSQHRPRATTSATACSPLNVDGLLLRGGRRVDG